jgi:hypothetical protein
MKSLVLFALGMTAVTAATPVIETLTVRIIGAVADHQRAPAEKRALTDEFELPAGSSMLDLLVAAGGVGDAGDLGRIRIRRKLAAGTSKDHLIDAVSEL